MNNDFTKLANLIADLISKYAEELDIDKMPLPNIKNSNITLSSPNIDLPKDFN